MDKLLIFLAWIVVFLGAVTHWSHFETNHEKYVSAIQVIGVGFAIIFIWLSYRRNLSFEKQVDTGQKQAETSERNLFNDRLSRAVEATGHKRQSVRSRGLELLHNLVNETPQDSEDRKLIIRILYAYLRDYHAR